MNRFKNFFLKSEARWPVLLATLIAIFLLLFYRDYFAASDIGNREVIGRIVYKNNVVHRKFTDSTVWSLLQSNSKLTNMDLIRSERLSNAIIYLDKGPQIKIDENTMFFLDLSGGTPKLSFESGSIQIQRGKNGPGDLLIESGDSIIEAGNADLRLIRDGDADAGEGLSVLVRKGNASIQTGETIQSVSANQRADLAGGKIKVKEIELNLLKPEGQQVIASSASSSSSPISVRVPFDVKIHKKYTDPALEVSRNREFSKIVHKGRARQGTQNVDLKPGTYYWRLKARDPKSGKVDSSEVRKFSIVDNQPVESLQPSQSEDVTYVEDKPLIQFSWSENALANEYELQIAEDKYFKKIRKVVKSQSSSVGVSAMEPGIYYWRVKSRSSLENIPEKISSVKSFTVTKKDSYDAPRLEAPLANQKISDTAFKSGVLFVWQAMPELKRFKLQIARTPDFKQLLYSTDLRDNFINLTEAMPVGKYYWRVRGGKVEGIQSKFSEVGRFDVVLESENISDNQDRAAEDGRLKLLGPQGVVDMSRKQNLRFRWKGEAGSRGYNFVLYRMHNRRAVPVLRRTLRGTEFVLRDLSVLDIGSFRWSVQVRRPGGRGNTAAGNLIIKLGAQQGLRPEDVEFISPEVIYK